MKKSAPKLTKILDVFEKNYKEIPLEYFSGNPYQTLVSTMLSSRTNDDTTFVACQKLFKAAKSFKELKKVPVKQIEKLIYPVGFYRVKAKNLKKMANIIESKFGSAIPQTFNELVTLPGVGRKTANLVLNRAFGVPAIAVDTHLHRIANILKIVHTKTPKQTEIKLMEVVPKKDWSKLNKLFVSVGRQFRSEKKLLFFLKSYGLLEDH